MCWFESSLSDQKMRINQQKPKHLTPAQRSKLRRRWWTDGRVICGICFGTIRSFDEYCLDHITQGKMGARRDDSESNMQPAHILCNFEKGSKREGEEASLRRKGREQLRAGCMRMHFPALSTPSPQERGRPLELGKDAEDMGEASQET